MFALRRCLNRIRQWAHKLASRELRGTGRVGGAAKAVGEPDHPFAQLIAELFVLDAQQQVRPDPLGAITRVVAPPTEHDTEDRGLAPTLRQSI